MALDHWEKLAKARQLVYDRAAHKTVQTISRAYDKAEKQIYEDMRGILDNFQNYYGLTREEAETLLSGQVSDAFLRRFRERIATLKDGARRRALEAELSAKAYRARLTRLEAIRYSAKVSMAQVADVEAAQDKMALQDGASIAYNRALFDVQKTVGMMFQTEGMSTRRAAEILRQNWSGKLYSARVWNNCNAVAEQVATLMTEMVMSGKASRQSMDELVGQAIDNGRMAANRLLRTEYNHAAGQAEMEAYTDAKVTHYRYIAVLDGRTSKVCQELDGKVFPIAERKVGKNMHPMHPWCRSSTAPVINGVVLKSQKRIARDLRTGKIEYIPATMTYNEWIKSKTK